MNSDELQRVKFDQAKRLNILGFNWPTDSGYGSDGSLLGCASCTSVGFCGRCLAPLGFIFPAPTVALALKWMRDVKGINSHVGYESLFIINAGKHFYCVIYEHIITCDNVKLEFETYEAAESALLDAAITELERCEVGAE